MASAFSSAEVGHRWSPKLLLALPASCFKWARSQYLLNQVSGLPRAPAERRPRTSTEGMRDPPGVRHAAVWRGENTARSSPRTNRRGRARVGVRDLGPTGPSPHASLAKDSRSPQLPPRLRRGCLFPAQPGRDPPPPAARPRPFRRRPRPRPAPPRARLRVFSAPAPAESTLDALRSPTGPACGGRRDGGKMAAAAGYWRRLPQSRSRRR